MTHSFEVTHQKKTLNEQGYHALVMDLLLALKGSRPSIEISKSMGYKYNQFKRWETGEKQLRWDEFCHLCDTLEIPISDVLQRVFQYHEPDPRQFLRHLYANKFPVSSIEELSKLLHRHSSAIRRYIDGEIFPDLEFVLAFIDLDANRLGTFVLAILPASEGEALRSSFAQEHQQLIHEANNPLAAAIEGWLISQGYLELSKHDPEYIASRVGCSGTEVTRILSNMLGAGTVIQLENGKFAPSYDKIEMSGIELPLMLQFFKFWYERGAKHYKTHPFSHQGPVLGTGVCRVVPVSQRVSDEINRILLRADAQIRSLIESTPNDEPCDDVRVILMKAFSTQDF